MPGYARVRGGRCGGDPRWHARGQGFKSPQLHPRSTALSAADRPRISALAQQIRSNRPCATKALVQRRGHPGHHRRGRLPIDTAHRAAAGVAVAAATGVAHQLINDPRGDGGILQPRREGMPQVMRAPQVEMGEVGPPGPGRTRSSGRPPPASWRAIASRTRSHIGTTRTLARLFGSALKPRPNRPAS